MMSSIWELSAQLMCNADILQAALLNSPRQRRKGQKGTPTMKGDLLFPIDATVNVMLAFYVLSQYLGDQ